jgi:hypothetical protein
MRCPGRFPWLMPTGTIHQVSGPIANTGEHSYAGYRCIHYPELAPILIKSMPGSCSRTPTPQW